MLTASNTALALELGADWIALIFVQRPEDVTEARALIGDRALIVSKLGKPAAVARLDEIVALSDAVMVARGDLGVELPAERVPTSQKCIVRSCRRLGKPVIVATQMLASMVDGPVPTRAEASDVATALYDGADAVMLSAESASGQHPLAAVDMMNRIIEQTEAPILSLTPHIQTARRLALAWGVHSVNIDDVADARQMTAIACEIARRERFASPGQTTVAIAGMPFGEPGTTNLLRIATV